VQLIGKRLAEGQTVADSRGGLGDRIIQVTAGAATTVGTAAGLAISAPVALVDPQTRETLGAHTEELGRSVSDVAARREKSVGFDLESGLSAAADAKGHDSSTRHRCNRTRNAALAPERRLRVRQ
jgi:hypothetical protein